MKVKVTVFNELPRQECITEFGNIIPWCSSVQLTNCYNWILLNPAVYTAMFGNRSHCYHQIGTEISEMSKNPLRHHESPLTKMWSAVELLCKLFLMKK